MPRNGSFRPPALVLLMALAWALHPGVAHAQRPGSDRSACVSCHPGLDAHYDLALRHAPSVTCLTCHHIGTASDPAAARDPQAMARRRAEACVRCHANIQPTHPRLAGSGPACTVCHNMHGDPTLVGRDLVADRLCRLCHAQPHSLHAGLAGAPACGACHTLHSDQRIQATVTGKCRACHAHVHPSHARAIAGGAMTCTRCHGVNAAPAVAQVDTLLSAQCRECHGGLRSSHGSLARTAGLGRKNGVPAGHAPDCVSCHDFATDPPIAQAGPTISRRCGACHPRELSEFEAGAHAGGIARNGANKDLPNCTTCHVEHGKASHASLRLVATERCIACHSRGGAATKYGIAPGVGASYVDDFHGSTVMFLANPSTAGAGRPDVLVCSDCHGAHAVGLRRGQSVSGVCLQCHRKADVRLASAWLGHGTVSPQNHALVWVIRLFYHVFIPFVLIGLFLNIVFHLSDQRRKGARLRDAPGVVKLRNWLARRHGPPETMVTRFTPIQRLEHIAALLTFTMLVVTGLPQTAPSLPVADKLIAFFGGIGSTRIIHRTFGFMFVALLLQHVTRGAVGIVRNRRLPQIAPRKHDFLDTVQTVRHYLSGVPRPKVGKYDASEKFEYWGLFLGGMLMSVTGLVLVFPAFVSHVLPGSVVAAMRVMHGLEATFAVLVVLLWHSYGVILRPEIFPLDTSIFTGKISAERLRDEHELDYEATFPTAEDVERAESEEAEEVGVAEADRAGAESPAMAGAENVPPGAAGPL